MFNSFVSKFKSIFNGQNLSPSTPASSPSPVVETLTDTSTTPARHRVTYVPETSPSPTPAPVAPAPHSKTSKLIPPTPALAPAAPAPTPVNPALLLEAQRALENARRLESDAKVKEQEILARLTSVNEKEKYLIQKEKNLDHDRLEVQTKTAAIDDLYRKQLEKLEAISGIDIEKAKQLILSSTEKKMASWISRKISEAKDQLRQREDEVSKEILVDALRHGLTDYVAEYTVSTITIPDDKIKGKIIGREGRNIRAFEKATGVELELDEGNDIRISSFDSTRREIAKLTLEKLVKDGRIQPLRIETLVAQTKADMDKILVNEGRRISQEVGVFNLPLDLLKTIGKFKYRFSYGQNLAKHTIEASKIATALAYELKADVTTVRLGTLLHDIGKVIADQEGTHIDVGIDFLRQFHIPQKVLDCVAEHHQDKEFSSVESVIVYLGDASSGARPGARYEVHEEYLKRMTNIEEVAKSYPGVLSVAAYQAGREVMVIVDPGLVSDSEAEVLSHNIADKLEEEAKWAGQIRVTCIRELRVSSTVVPSKINNNAVKP
ncbi:MAG: Rnase Y domain-containing protein [Candidatus Shapirobacteria bacterium]